MLCLRNFVLGSRDIIEGKGRERMGGDGIGGDGMGGERMIRKEMYICDV